MNITMKTSAGKDGAKYQWGNGQIRVSHRKLNIQMAQGGGFAMKITSL